MLPKIKQYTPPNPNLWQGRKDSLPHERFFQQVNCIDIKTTSLSNRSGDVIIGFCSDEGIRRNSGRPGAKAGPDSLRSQLAKLAAHSHRPLIDIGNIVCEDGLLEEAQAQFAELIAHSHQKGHKTIALGGGHEIAWAHFSGLIKQFPNIGIINFDAHFDLRPVQGGLGNSGTPFWQMKTYCDQMNLPFNYCCLGIQPTANTNSLFARATEWNVSYLTAEQMNTSTSDSQIAFLDQFMSKHDCIYLTICLDVFNEAVAPGVSAPQPLGLNPTDTLPLLKYIAQTGKVVGLDIAELSPPLDWEQKTARLAAVMLAELLNLH